MVLERKVLVEEKADDASHHIVGSGGNPIGAIGKVVEQKHGPTANQSVEHSHYQELDHGWVNEFLHFSAPSPSPQ